MMEIVNIGLLVAVILSVWFQSEAFVEYVRLFHLNWLFAIREYDRQKEDDLTLTYIQFLRLNYKNVFIRLITCPLCLSLWISFVLATVFFMIVWWPTIVVIGLGAYYLIKRLSN